VLHDFASWPQGPRLIASGDVEWQKGLASESKITEGAARMDAKDTIIEELTLLLLDLTSWREDGMGAAVRRAWKGYPFEALDALEAKGFLAQGRRAKSVYLTDTGALRAAELRKKYIG
jgi:hypothetical protein